MDIKSLVCWRETCATNYAQSTASLSRTLTRLVSVFLSHPNALLRLITEFGAVIGGEAALAYIRREVPFRPRSLEIFVGRLEYEPFCRAILSNPDLAPDAILASSSVVGYPLCSQRDIVETLQLRLRSGLSIYLRRSSTLSPLSPITRAYCTALMNFVSPRCFGCAYPRLTLNNRALVCDVGMRNIDYGDSASRTAVVGFGIETSVNPARWSQYCVWSATPSNEETVTACWRSHFICPGQGRYFGDRGSLVGLVSPLNSGPEESRDIRALLFGSTIVWRLSSSYRCIMRCEGRDRLLPIGVTSHVITFVHDELQNLGNSSPGRGRCFVRDFPSKLHVLRRFRSLPR